MIAKSLADKLSLALKQDVAHRHAIPISSISSEPSRDVSLLRALDNGSLIVDGYEIDLIRDLRQVSRFTYKLKVAPTKSQNEEAKKAFLVRNQRCCSDGGSGLLSAARSVGKLPDYPYRAVPGTALGRVAQLAQLLCQALVRSYTGPAIPRHGPGTTFFSYCTRIEKYAYLERDVPSEIMIRMAELFRPSPSCDFIEGLPTQNVCRIASVPKDARGPRLVAPHMASAMWAQQAVLGGIEESLDKSLDLLNHHILYEENDVRTLQLRDQSINKRLARLGSIQPWAYATLDLKDASDLVSWKLVQFLFQGTTLLEDLRAVRAKYVLVDGVEHELHMHAPMGSACCFPVLAMTLWSLAVATMYVCDEDVRVDELQSYRVSRKTFCNVQKPFVFGDDVIMPPQYVDAYRTVLNASGLILNEKKTFTGLFFRESCGGDYYKGVDISTTLLRVSGTSDVRSVVGLITLYNRVCDKYWNLGEEILQHLVVFSRTRRHFVAFSSDKNEGSCVTVYNVLIAIRLNRSIGNIVRYNSNFQRWEVLVVREVTGKAPTDRITDSRARLYEGLLGRGSDARIASTRDLGGTDRMEWESKDSHVAQVWLAL